jgi:hypothetical protein
MYSGITTWPFDDIRVVASFVMIVRLLEKKALTGVSGLTNRPENPWPAQCAHR